MAHPTTVTEVQNFLGFTGYYHQVIPKFVQVAQPLHELMYRKNAGKKKVTITWDDRCQQSFDDLKCLCTTAPILAHADFMKVFFKLQTNACGSGLELSSTRLMMMGPLQSLPIPLGV